MLNISASALLREHQLAYIAEQLTDRGFAVVDGWLPPGELAPLRAEADRLLARGEFQRAGIGRAEDYQLNQGIRGDYIHWLDHRSPTAVTRDFFATLDELVAHLNRHLFLGLRELEMHLAVYPVGAAYKRHLDVFQQQVGRRLSVICYLNDGWTDGDGGQLRMYLPQEYGGEVVEDVLPLGGRLVLFLSDQIEHEVLPARRERYSVTGWLRNQALPW